MLLRQCNCTNTPILTRESIKWMNKLVRRCCYDCCFCSYIIGNILCTDQVSLSAFSNCCCFCSYSVVVAVAAVTRVVTINRAHSFTFMISEIILLLCVPMEKPTAAKLFKVSYRNRFVLCVFVLFIIYYVLLECKIKRNWHCYEMYTNENVCVCVLEICISWQMIDFNIENVLCL